MTAMELINTVRGGGFELIAAGDRIRFRSKEPLPEDLRAELHAHKSEVLQMLDAEAQVNPGWPPEGWSWYLRHRAGRCDDPEIAEKLRARATAVEVKYGLDMEVDG